MTSPDGEFVLVRELLGQEREHVTQMRLVLDRHTANVHSNLARGPRLEFPFGASSRIVYTDGHIASPRKAAPHRARRDR